MASTELREAAQQALGAMRCAVPTGKITLYEWDKAVSDLDAALAEPVQEPVALETVYETIIHWDEGGGKRSRRELARRIVALYPAPPQRNPLSDADLAKIWDDALDQLDPRDQLRFIARAIERAHGIDGAPEERNFCPRCGKRTNDIHTCTPPAPLTDEVIADLWHQNGGFHHHFARAIERWLRGHA